MDILLIEWLNDRPIDGWWQQSFFMHSSIDGMIDIPENINRSIHDVVAQGSFG